MPYVTQSRVVPGTTLTYSIISPTGVDETVESQRTTVYNVRETVYTYRTQGTDDKGDSLRYEDLPGDVLRSEAMSQSWGATTGDSGHIFWKTTAGAQVHEDDTYVASSGGAKPYVYTGYIYPAGTQLHVPGTPSAPSTNTLNSLGSRAVAGAAPGSPPIDLLVGLVELFHEGLPALIGARTAYSIAHYEAGMQRRGATLEAVGSEWLNLKFGHVPLANDIATLANISLRFQDLWKQFEVKAMTQVRRKRVVEERSTFEYGSVSGTSLGMGRRAPGGTGAIIDVSLFFPSSTGTCRWHEETRVKTWFSGCWTYHLDPWEKYFSDSYVGRAQRLLGLSLTPDVVWNLTPWTWLFDWFANVGNMLRNLSNKLQYSQVMRYGYLMREETRTRVLYRDPLRDGGGNLVGPFVVSCTNNRKDRVRATPYGFGVDLGGLNPTQWSILGALGLTKGPKSLRAG